MSTLVGDVVNVPFTLLVVSLTVTPFVNDTIAPFSTTISPIPLNSGFTVSTFIVSLQLTSLSLPEVC